MWAIILVLILVGFVLLTLEIMVIPGVGITGIFGFLLIIGGIWLAYSKEGIAAGNITLLITLLVSAISIAVMLRSKTWEKAQLETSISSKIPTFNSTDIRVGMHGETTSRCAPMGKAVFGHHHVEVDAGTNYLPTGTPVEIVRINGNKIYIKQLKT